MTTKHSSLRALQVQADRIAATVKAAGFRERLGERGKNESVKIAVVMDDKTLIIETPWTTIQSTSEAGLSEYIVKKMRESRDDH